MLPSPLPPPGSSFCHGEEMYGIRWPAWVVRMTVNVSCPGGGTASRYCTPTAVWDDPDLFDCLTPVSSLASCRYSSYSHRVLSMLNCNTCILSALIVNMCMCHTYSALSPLRTPLRHCPALEVPHSGVVLWTVDTVLIRDVSMFQRWFVLISM